MVSVNVVFLKKRYYRGKLYNIEDECKMSNSDLDAYLKCKVVKLKTKNKNKSYKDMSYRELQKLCKSKSLPAVGSKEDLINYLEGKKIEIEEKEEKNKEDSNEVNK